MRQNQPFLSRNPALMTLLIVVSIGGYLAASFLTSAPSVPANITGDPTSWPQRAQQPLLTAAEELRLKQLLDQMTLEQKVGQLIVGDISTVEPSHLQEYPLGAILAGGNSAPGENGFAAMETWLATADAYYESAMSATKWEVIIPPLFGTDAVHGHNNVLGSVIFPHNVGLGAANDPVIVEEIGAVTARALAATGHDWTFAPTVAVAEDPRWGRAYESFSQDPERVRVLSRAFVKGLQSQPVGNGMIVGTAKHFIADGGTSKGRDRGDARIPEHQLAEVHGAGYYGALEAGVSTIMGSFSSWNGTKIHAHKYLLTDVLRGRMAFNGFVVSDWNAHAQIPGCRVDDCPVAINAGVDMLMSPWDWSPLYDSVLNAARSGKITEARLNEAVTRILAVKLKSGLLDGTKPSARLGAGSKESLAGAGVKRLARDAARKSQVLLKNENDVLPLSQEISTLSVIGLPADSFSHQSGGWTLTWQASDVSKQQFPFGETLIDALRDHPASHSMEITFDSEDAQKTVPDVAIVVLAEPSYAEFQGDTTTLRIPKENEPALKALDRLGKLDVPVVTVVFSGRPIWIEKVLSASDAVVAGWLPGSQAGGVADVLFGTLIDGAPTNFEGTLSVHWPKNKKFTVQNGEEALFPIGYGLTYH